MENNWSKIQFRGIKANDGSEYIIHISKPKLIENAYACSVMIPGVVDRKIYQESGFLAFSAAIMFVEKIVYEPAASLIEVTNLTEDSFPDLEIEIIMA